MVSQGERRIPGESCRPEVEPVFSIGGTGSSLTNCMSVTITLTILGGVPDGSMPI
jgi:hypothetical protein